MSWKELPRPRNGFFMFRAVHDKEYSARLGLVPQNVVASWTEGRNNLSSTSSFLGNQWNCMPEVQREFFQNMAQREDQLHRDTYPGIAFNPGSGVSKKCLSEVVLPGYLSIVEVVREYHEFLRTHGLAMFHEPSPELGSRQNRDIVPLARAMAQFPEPMVPLEAYEVKERNRSKKRQAKKPLERPAKIRRTGQEAPQAPQAQRPLAPVNHGRPAPAPGDLPRASQPSSGPAAPRHDITGSLHLPAPSVNRVENAMEVPPAAPQVNVIGGLSFPSVPAPQQPQAQRPSVEQRLVNGFRAAGIVGGPSVSTSSPRGSVVPMPDVPQPDPAELAPGFDIAEGFPGDLSFAGMLNSPESFSFEEAVVPQGAAAEDTAPRPARTQAEDQSVNSPDVRGSRPPPSLTQESPVFPRDRPVAPDAAPADNEAAPGTVSPGAHMTVEEYQDGFQALDNFFGSDNLADLEPEIHSEVITFGLEEFGPGMNAVMSCLTGIQLPGDNASTTDDREVVDLTVEPAEGGAATEVAAVNGDVEVYVVGDESAVAQLTDNEGAGEGGAGGNIDAIDESFDNLVSDGDSLFGGDDEYVPEFESDLMPEVTTEDSQMRGASDGPASEEPSFEENLAAAVMKELGYSPEGGRSRSQGKSSTGPAKKTRDDGVKKAGKRARSRAKYRPTPSPSLHELASPRTPESVAAEASTPVNTADWPDNRLLMNAASQDEPEEQRAAEEAETRGAEVLKTAPVTYEEDEESEISEEE
ncbi:slightly ste11-like protein [Parahypoxylon ruwenzoriense]